MEKIYKYTIIVVMIISTIVIFNMANIILGQSAKIQMLKQSNIEQQEGKEYYINRYKELEEKTEVTNE